MLITWNFMFDTIITRLCVWVSFITQPASERNLRELSEFGIVFQRDGEVENQCEGNEKHISVTWGELTAVLDLNFNSEFPGS